MEAGMSANHAVSCVSFAMICLASLCLPRHAEGAPGDSYIVAYAGRYSDSALAEDILTLQEIVFEDAYLATVGYGRIFRQPSERRHWEMEAQLARWFGDQTNYELNAAVIHRWNAFPWDHRIDTSLAIGNGLSWATDTPELEEKLEVDGTERLLYYLSLEAAFSPPTSDRWAVILRMHHRSGMFGLFGVSSGSNTLSLGLRFNLN
jgi:hypothetical protein